MLLEVVDLSVRKTRAGGLGRTERVVTPISEANFETRLV